MCSKRVVQNYENSFPGLKPKKMVSEIVQPDDATIIAPEEKQDKIKSEKTTRIIGKTRDTS